MKNDIEIKVGQAWALHGSSDPIFISNVSSFWDSAFGISHNCDVITWDDSTAETGFLSMFRHSFLIHYHREPSMDKHPPRAFRLRNKLTGKYNAASGRDTVHGKTWGAIGYLKLAIHSRVAISPWKEKNDPGFNRKRVVDFLSKYEAVEILPTGVRIMPITEWLPDEHQAYLNSTGK